jgi:hypothetical protein
MAVQADLSARECGDDDVTAGRGPGQRGWYEWIAGRVARESVLDVGCGMGYGLEILRRSAASVRGQDLDSRLSGPSVYIRPLSELESAAVDVCVAVDVVEHVVDDAAFVADLARIARRRVIITTPNWTASRCAWPYHVREYTPRQLRTLCEPFGRVRMWKGEPTGKSRYPIRFTAGNDLLNRARVTPGLSTASRVFNRALPVPARIHSHLAIEIELGATSLS